MTRLRRFFSSFGQRARYYPQSRRECTILTWSGVLDSHKIARKLGDAARTPNQLGLSSNSFFHVLLVEGDKVALLLHIFRNVITMLLSVLGICIAVCNVTPLVASILWKLCRYQDKQPSLSHASSPSTRYGRLGQL